MGVQALPYCSTVMVIFLREQRRTVRDVALVGEQQLQGVFAGGSVECRLGLALAEVHDLVGGRQRRAEVRGRIGVDEQVMVAGVLELHARRGDAHALEAELHQHRGVHSGAVLRADDVDLGAGG